MLPAPPSDAKSVSRKDLAAVIFAIVLPSLVTWAYFFQADAASPQVQTTIYGLAKVVQFGFPLAWVLWMQRRRFERRPLRRDGIVAGVTFGAVVAVAAIALFRFGLSGSEVLGPATEQIRDKIAGLGITRGWQYFLLGAFYSLCHSWLEEYYWRWFVFAQLRLHISVPAAIAVSSLGFMAHHVLVLGKFFGPGHWATWFFSFCVAVGGAAWAWLYQRTGSLVGPWLSHLLVDAAIFWIGWEIVSQAI
ncbi:CPBP family intramembrane metalloprotease [Pirellulales bacterium]|nr:CPBP family intramembrane metalloprotease [Pirellulales bacterium]